VPRNWEPENWAQADAARVARAITRLREEDGKSAQWISDRTTELGCRISRAVITDLENGRRRYVAVHELVMLAKALELSPLQLLYTDDDGAQIEIRPGESVPRLVAVQEFSGINEAVLNDYESQVQQLLKSSQYVASATRELHRLLKREGSADGG